MAKEVLDRKLSMREMWQITSQLRKVPDAQSFVILSDEGKPWVVRMEDLYLFEKECEDLEKILAL